MNKECTFISATQTAIKIWKNAFYLAATLPLDEDIIMDLSISSDDKYLALCLPDNSIVFWNL